MKLKTNFFAIAAVCLFTGLNAQNVANKNAAENWLKENRAALKVLPESSFKMEFYRPGASGETYRYQQTLGGVPVYQSEIIVHYNKNNEMSYTATENLKQIQKIDTTPTISADEAYQAAYTASNSSGEISHQENKLYVYNTEDNQTKLVYRVVINSFNNPGSWETIVDAKTGEIISVKDIAFYHNHNGDEKGKKKNTKTADQPPLKATGTAYVFNPDPLSFAHVAYGGQYVDNNDATNASLDAARSLVNIPELELAGGVYKLKGTYAEIKEIEAPATGLFTQASPDFLFNRNQQGFEAVNAYWHIDKQMRYINQTLGIPLVSLFNGGVVFFDPHGFNGDDNSYYSAGKLVFGEGCVDDAEDADVIIHELGHGLHDWLTNGNLSQTQGLSEGTGDYFAQSYSRALNQWQPTEAAYHYVFSWDGHNTCWAGRTTAYVGNYPPPSGNGIHSNGQLWATVLMKIYDRIGKQKIDRAVIEGLSNTGASTNQKQAATAVRQAALDFAQAGQFGFTCSDVNAFTEEFNAKNFALPAVTCTVAATAEVTKGKMTLFPNPANDKINVILPEAKNQTIEIYSVDGRKVMQAEIDKTNHSVNVSQLSKGIYIIQAKGTDMNEKFIKN